MLTDGISLIDGAVASNFSIQYGTSLPGSGNNVGELFFLTTGNSGLYLYDGSNWVGVSAAEVDFTSLNVKAACRAATTANITLSGLQTIDGVALNANDRVLVKNQAAGQQNGIYVAAAGAWARSSDFDGSPANEVKSGDFTFITEGTVNAERGYILTTDGTITIDSTTLTFAQFNSGGAVVGGADTQVQYNSSGALAGSAKFTWNNSTNVLALGATSNNPTITVLGSPGTGVAGTALTVSSGMGGTIGDGGDLTIQAGQAGGGGSNTGGDLNLFAGAGNGSSSAGGAVIIRAGGSTSNTTAGAVTIQGGAGPGGFSSGAAGNVIISGGDSDAAQGAGNGGTLFLRGGMHGGAGGAGGPIIFQTSTTTSQFERFRILANGAWSIGTGGTDYGTSGQVLTSNGNAAPTWQTASFSPALTATQIGFGSGSNLLTGSAGFTWIDGSNTLQIGPQSTSAGGTITTRTHPGPGGGNGLLITTANNSDNPGQNITINPGVSGSGYSGPRIQFVAAGGSPSSGYLVFSSGTGATGVYTERLRILGNGAWSVGTGGAATGTSGQVLTSTGATTPPTWQAASAGALTATQIGFGSGSNLVTGSTNFTWNDGTRTLSFSGNASEITVANTATIGHDLTLRSGPGTTGASGDLNLYSGVSTSGGAGGTVRIRTFVGTSNAAAGSIILQTGPGIGSGTGGDITLTSGGAPSGVPGLISLNAGSRTGGTGVGGGIQISSGNGFAAGAGGTVNIVAGNGGATTGGGGIITISAGNSGVGSSGDGGEVRIEGGTSPSGAAGGPIRFRTATTTTLVERFRILGNGSWSIGTAGTNVGTSGQVVMSNGTGTAPTWQTFSDFGARYTEPRTAVTATASTSLDTSTANSFVITMSASITTLSFTNVPASGRVYSMTLFLNQAGAGGFTITWPASVKWSGAVAPTLTTTSGKTDIVTLVTHDGGTNWFGFIGGLNF